ncbi:hypothetical protein A9Q76_04630, partial [Arcobacter sp. 31_11_sub10_T18]
VRKIEINSKDEIGEMAKAINDNIVKTQSLMEEDQLLIDDVKSVANLVKEGKLKQQIQKTTSNESLKELKEIFNEMLTALSKDVCHDLVEIRDALQEFQKLNFSHRIDNPTGKASEGLNSLANVINEMLVDNQQSGMELQKSSDELLSNVDSLSITSSETAVSLEQTSAALKDTTDNIVGSNKSIIEMSEYINMLSLSTNEGQELSKQTNIAMDEINEEVESINKAISLINQIAFQTNILSLNAAVEAATAGEQGKGFAVVAGEVRNLAARSTEVADEIKTLVENATVKANSGKVIADKMIAGYAKLNENVSKTLDHIKIIADISKEQKSKIEQISDAVISIDSQTQENASLASKSR